MNKFKRNFNNYIYVTVKFLTVDRLLSRWCPWQRAPSPPLAGSRMRATSRATDSCRLFFGDRGTKVCYRGGILV